MKSRTSYSKLTPFKKDIARFAPLWALYLIGMLLVLLDSGSHYAYDRYARNFVAELIPAFSVVNLIYAGVVAAALFGDLYNTKMCYSLHTMPQRREHWLLSHLAAGLLFSLVPNVVTSLLLMIWLKNYWFIALYWLLAVTLQFIFYFGLAALSAMLTGNRFAMLLIYAGFNFVSMLVYALVEVFYVPMLTGVVASMESFTPFCPTWFMLDNLDCFKFNAVEVYSQEYMGYVTFYEYAGLGTGWGYMTVIAAIGAGMMGLSFLVYRLRHLESAGDFIAFPKLHGVACLIMTLCVAVVFSLAGELMGSGYIVWLCVGVVIGYFGSLMLLERRVKVFRPKVFAWFGVLCAAIIASILLISFDVFGIVDWTPKAEQVEYVTLSNYRTTSGYYYDGYYSGSRISVKLEEDEDIDAIITAHQDILDRLDEETDSSHYVVLQYKLSSGRTVTRAYRAPASGVNYSIIQSYLYTPQSVLGYDDWDTFVNNLCYMYLDGQAVPEGLYTAVIEAARLDCENGAITTGYSNEYCYLDYETKGENGLYFYRSLCVTTRAENLITLMKSPAYIMGYGGAWEDYVDSIYYLIISGGEFSITPPEEEWDSLLSAILADCENGNVSIDHYGNGEYSLELCADSESGDIVSRWLTFDKEAQNTIDWLTIHGYLEGGC